MRFALASIVLLILAACSSNASSYPQPLQQVTSENNVTVVGLAASQAAPSLGLVFDATGVIVHVEPNGAAAIAGIQPEERLVSVEQLDPLRESVRIREVVAERGIGGVLNVTIQGESGTRDVMVTLSAVPPSTNTQTPLPTVTPVLPPFNYL